MGGKCKLLLKPLGAQIFLLNAMQRNLTNVSIKVSEDINNNKEQHLSKKKNEH